MNFNWKTLWRHDICYPAHAARHKTFQKLKSSPLKCLKDVTSYMDDSSYKQTCKVGR